MTTDTDQPDDAAPLPATTIPVAAAGPKLPAFMGDSSPAGAAVPADQPGGTALPMTTIPVAAPGPKLPPFLGDSAPAGRRATGSPARRMSVAVLLTSAVPLAVAAAALAAAPLAAAIPVAAPVGAQHAATLAGEDCGTSQTGMAGSVKWPDCAGD
jgi:hypothetical protein